MTKARILVADDEPHIIRIVRDKLTNADYEVICVDNGTDAVDKALQLKPDMVLLDVMMPGLNGFEVCRRLKSEETFANVPIYLLTARGQTRDIQEGTDAGADKYITKPFSPRALLKEVEEALAGVEGNE